MTKLEKNLKEWVSKGFIAENQAQLIRHHEESKQEYSWILSGLLILGAVIVGIGVISIIAANWEYIPDSLKIVANFILLISLAIFTYKSWDSTKTIQFEVLLLSFLIHCMATIGLISQIYHTGGYFDQALMLWSLITFFAMLAARGLFIPLIWTGAFLSGLIYSAMDSMALQFIFHKNYLAIMMTSTYLCACFAILSRSFAGDIGTTRAFRIWTLLIGIMGLIAAECVNPSMKIINENFYPYIPGYFLAAYALVEIWQSREYRRVQKIILMMTITAFLIPFHLPVMEIKSTLIFAVFTILVLGLISIFLASLKERRSFQLFLSFLGIRFLILYFQALGGLARTGLGLILSGAIVIALAILWNKYKTAFAEWAEEVLQ